MSSLPHSLVNAAANYKGLSDSKKKAFIEKMLAKDMSVKAIAEACATYPNKIRRDAQKFKLDLPDKSTSQKAALASGRHKHPTKGTQRSTEIRHKIGDSVAESWSTMSSKDFAKRSAIAKKQWLAKSPEEIAEFQRKSAEAMREASKNGSKLEHYLLGKLIEEGYQVDFHKEHFILNERLQVDLYLPILKTALEIDGPSHFKPIWGEQKLAKSQLADATKDGLLLDLGMCVIRLQQTKDLSGVYKRQVLKQLLDVLEKIDQKFPVDNDDRYIILGDEE